MTSSSQGYGTGNQYELAVNLNEAQNSENVDNEHHDFVDIKDNAGDDILLDERELSKDGTIQKEGQVKQYGHTAESLTESKTGNLSTQISRKSGDLQRHNATPIRIYLDADKGNKEMLGTWPKGANLNIIRAEHNKQVNTYPRSISYSVVDEWFRGNYRNEIITSNAGASSGDSDELNSPSSSEGEVENMNYAYSIRHVTDGDGDTDNPIDSESSVKNDSSDKHRVGVGRCGTAKISGMYTHLSSESSISSDTFNSDAKCSEYQEWQGPIDIHTLDMKDTAGPLEHDSNIGNGEIDSEMGSATGSEAENDNGGFRSLSSDSSLSSDTLTSDTKEGEDQPQRNANRRTTNLDRNRDLLEDEERYVEKSRLDRYMKADGGCATAKDREVTHISPSSESNVGAEALSSGTRRSDDQEWGGDLDENKFNLEDAEDFEENDNLDKYMAGPRRTEPVKDNYEYTSWDSESSVSSERLSSGTNNSNELHRQGDVEKHNLSLKDTRAILDDDSNIRESRFEKYVRAGGGCEIAKNRSDINHRPLSSESSQR